RRSAAGFRPSPTRWCRRSRAEAAASESGFRRSSSLPGARLHGSVRGRFRALSWAGPVAYLLGRLQPLSGATFRGEPRVCAARCPSDTPEGSIMTDAPKSNRKAELLSTEVEHIDIRS